LALDKMSRYGDALKQWKAYLQVAEKIPDQKDWVPKAHEQIRYLEEKLRSGG